MICLVIQVSPFQLHRFVLAKPADTTELLEDVSLLNDLLRIVMGCFVAGACCSYLKCAPG
jgi:hypothetical protein